MKPGTFIKSPFILLKAVFLFFITYLPGPSGYWLRYQFYKRKFKSCGKNVIIDVGVIISGTEHISIGDNVWIDKYSILIAGPIDIKEGICKKIENHHFAGKPGELIIGNCVHIGAFNILQAHGGMSIGNSVTTSAGVKLYSLSNYPYDENNREIVTFANCVVEDRNRVSYIISPIVVEDGVWIALDCLVLGGRIGSNSFISSQSVVYHDIAENSYASGKPAQRIKDRFELRGRNE